LKIGYAVREGRAYANLGTVYQLLGNDEKAREYFNKLESMKGIHC